jgi:hypothetical protein
MKIILSLILLSTILCQEADQSCKERCALVAAPTNLCAQDGKIYDSSCEAFCESPNNYILASFEDFERDEAIQRCKETARQHNCRQECGSNRDSHLFYCTNLSNIFSNLCRARCIQPETEFLWECSRIGYGSINCRFKCNRYHQCKTQCAEAETQEPTCASDGMFYTSQCELDCNELTAITDPEGNKITGESECLEFAKQLSEEGLGPKKIK